MPDASDQTPTAADEAKAARAANRFDIRRIIGGLFTVWGVLLIILGATDSEQEANKAAGININLYWGIVLLVFGASMLFLALRGGKKPGPPQK